MKYTNKDKTYRMLFYVFGLVILALGICLNARTELGVSPIVSVAYTFSNITNIDFGDATFGLYVVFVIIEIIIHLIQKKNKEIPFDLLQIVVSLIFTRVLNVFYYFIPNFKTDLVGTIYETMYMRIIFLIIAIILTGIGAALSINMQIVPNPGDGIVRTISTVIHKSVGFTKNCLDTTCVIVSCTIGLVLRGHLIGIGIGTVLAMIGVGRVIAIFNYFTRTKIDELAGLATSEDSNKL